MRFGEILQETRERKGLDLNATARRLRIRPDILRAIEAGDFPAMPPRGYTRNMVNGYARFLGLNATDITSMYLEELAEYQEGVMTSRRRSTGFDMSEAPDNTRFPRRGSTTRWHPEDVNGARSAQGQRGARRAGSSYADGLQSMERSRGFSQGTGRKVYPESRINQSRGSVLPASSFIDQRGQGGSLLSTVRERLPFVVAALVVLVVVIVVCSLLFGGCSRRDEDVTQTMPVTGLDDSAQSAGQVQQQEAEAKAAETPPEKATFEFSVADGQETYIEVYVDGAVRFANDVTGPHTESYDFTGDLEFVCVDIAPVVVKLDGEPVQLVDDGASVYRHTFKFSDILAQWRQEHGVTTAADAQAGASGAQGAASGAQAGAEQSSGGLVAGNELAGTTGGDDAGDSGQDESDEEDYEVDEDEEDDE